MDTTEKISVCNNCRVVISKKGNVGISGNRCVCYFKAHAITYLQKCTLKALTYTLKTGMCL